MKRTVTAALAATSIFAATSATAATVTVEAHSTPNIFLDANGQNDWYVPTQFMVGTFQSDLTLAGVFRLKDVSNTISDFLAFCLEPTVPFFGTPTDYEMGSLFSGAVTESLQALASNAFDLVTDDNTAGAFQMAAWEIATETASIFDIDAGHFQITGAQVESDQAEVLAQTWLDNVQNNVWTASSEYLILNANGSQDLLTNITIAAVPVPASGLLLIGGLAGAGAIARRKKAAK